MNVHEYQAKEVLRQHGIPVPEFRVVASREEAEKALDELDGDQMVIKVMVHAGGRGKAGGVKLAKGRDEILSTVDQLLGLKIVNNQTGPEGVIAHKVMITPTADIKKEYYLGAVIDRDNARAALIASPDGGMDIEEVAHNTPERILTVPIGLDGSLKGFQLRQLAKFMGWSGDLAKQGMRIAMGVAKAFMDSDASLLEINPLVESTDGQLWAIDAKLGIDENALFRQKGISQYYDPTQSPQNEIAAKEHDLAYIALDGNIGCMVNGAGLAMATMDIIQHVGGKPANFLDVGGGASKEKVAEGFKILLSDAKVKGILVNIFGGIMDCGVLAEGIVAAAQELNVTVPLVVRMEGTNVDTGKAILKDSGLAIITADNILQAAEKAVSAAQG